VILPLWSPSPVTIGDVGFLERPAGSFKKLFNAFDLRSNSDKRISELPFVKGYGDYVQSNQRAERRNAAQRGVDLIHSWVARLPGSGPNHVSRQVTYTLRTGHKAAFLYTETTLYHYLDNLEAPKRWFQKWIDVILSVYGPKYNLQKEDVIFGT
jgi:abelson tyrosine-protein kinase 1